MQALDTNQYKEWGDTPRSYTMYRQKSTVDTMDIGYWICNPKNQTLWTHYQKKSKENLCSGSYTSKSQVW